MRYGPRNFLASLGLVVAGAVVSQALTPGGGAGAFLTAQSKSGQGAMMQVINGKGNDTLVFVYDEESKRVLMYLADKENGLHVAGIRNVTFDAKVNEFPKHPDDKLSYKEVKKAVEEEEKQKAEEDAKKAKDAKKKEEPAKKDEPPKNG